MQNDNPNSPPTPTEQPPVVAPGASQSISFAVADAKLLTDCLRWLLAGNPFYPLSAMLLLWGAYRLTVDPRFFPSEFSQLLFNFGSLQAYEVVLAGTAVLLAWRRLWYDSTLLAFIENLLVFVPTTVRL